MESFPPVFTALLAPLVVALAAAWALMRYLPAAAGLVAFVGYLGTVLLIASGEPLSLAPINRIVFIGGLAAVAGLTLDGAAVRLSRLFPFVWLIAAPAIVWVLWPAFKTMFVMNAVLYGYVMTVYTLWLTWALPWLRDRPVHAYVAVVALGMGTGGAAAFAGLVVTGMLAFGFAAAACAGLGMGLLARRALPAGYALTLPASITLVAVAGSALAYGQLSTICLVLLGLIPLFALIVPKRRVRSAWAALYLGPPLLLAVIAVLLAARPNLSEPFVPDPLRAIRAISAGGEIEEESPTTGAAIDEQRF